MKATWGRLTNAALASGLTGLDALVAVLRAAATIEAMSEAELGLTPGELRSLEAFSRSSSAETAAQLLGVSSSTVRQNLKRCRRKFGVTRSREAVARARERGLLKAA